MIPATPRAVRETLKALGLRPSRRLGQNFLADRNLRDAILDDAGIGSGDLVLEVGPGLGILTEGLLDRGASVLAVELDRGLAAFLRDELGGRERFRLIGGDAVAGGGLHPEVIEALDGLCGPEGGFKVVSNLPYSAATPVLVALVEMSRPPVKTVAMVQREVALRLTGRPGSRDYGPLAVLLALRGEVRIARDVGGRVFVPQPPVRSAVVEFVPHSCDDRGVRRALRVARDAFQHRRKTLLRALTSSGHDAERVAEALRHLGLPPRCRPEDVSPEDFVSIAARLCLEPI